MIKIKGMSYRTVELPDIGDRIYFGQDKVFTEEVFNSSNDLKAALVSKRLILLEGEVPLETRPPKIIEKQVIVERPVYIEKPVIVERVVPAPVTEEPRPLKVEPDSDINERTLSVLEQLSKQMGKLVDDNEAKRPTEKPSENVNAQIQETLQKFEKKMSGLVVSGATIVGTSRTTDSYKEEVYVPTSIEVTDLTRNVQLETRQIGQGDNVGNAVEKLKRLKSQQKSTT